MRVFVTGANGFVGRHLVPLLVKKEHQVFVGVRSNLDHYDSTVTKVLYNLVDNEIGSLINKIKPEAIIHLAAQSLVKKAWESPTHTFMENTIGTIQLIEAVKKFAPNAKIITIGSSEEYGLSGLLGEPLTEEHPCMPQNPYAISKYAAGQTSISLARKDGLNLIHIRPFNHFGPEQRIGFVISDFASQIALIEKLSGPSLIKVGDLSAKRDFTDVRDVINAYLAVLENDVQTGVYNVCSGQPRAIQEILNIMIKDSKIKIDVEVDQEKFRPSEVPIFIGSAEKIQIATGWKPERNFEESLFETLEWWRQR
ncbi:GDP-mannose 4,6-dehydratase [Paenibacillus sp. 2RAB27]|uniref:GDP-mannose 4,6-dehydratase n=1 Tax=Paenibacillus sp. 2RAB27 TaxID=3232991 RepID=UPI003F96E664